MLNKYPIWKYLLVLMVVILGIIYALPNFYPADPAVQITADQNQHNLKAATITNIRSDLLKHNIQIKSITQSQHNTLIRLKHVEDQPIAREIVKEIVGNDYIVALNLAQNTPKWLLDIGGRPMNLGLDLSGGVHFLLQVDSEKAVAARLNITENEIYSMLRKQKIGFNLLDDKSNKDQQKNENTRNLLFATSAFRDAAISLIRSKFNILDLMPYEDKSGYGLEIKYKKSEIQRIKNYAVNQNLTTLRNRVNELGVSEPLVQRQGSDGVVVELPGIQDTAEAKRILGKTANLEFRLQALPGVSDLSSDIFFFRDAKMGTARLERKVIITGDQVASAQSNFDSQTGQPQVNITLNSSGGRLMNQATRDNVGRAMAVLFIEQKPYEATEIQNKNGKKITVKVPKFRTEKRIISLATIQSALGNQFRITGLGSVREASELALLLRAGSLAAPMYFAEERTVGPSLGAENIAMGISSVIVGMIMLLMFMIVVYRKCGLLANIALTCNLMLLTAVMSLVGATLTLPGIAGIVLTLGMAVDANVLIFSRIREEIRNNRPIQQAIHDGFDRAFVSIFDGNITTLIVGIILFAVGTGSVKGFAVTLSLGIMTSMFTAIVVTRALVNLFYGGRRLTKLSI